MNVYQRLKLKYYFMEKLRSQRNFVLDHDDVEHITGVSQTVPNEAMSIRTILTKFSRGQRIDATLRRDGKFEDGSNFDSEDLESAERQSLTDRDEVVDRIKQKNDALKADILAKINEMAEAKKQKLAVKAKKQAESDSQNVGNGLVKGADQRDRLATTDEGSKEHSGPDVRR